MICPNCNCEVPNDAAFCPECGAQQTPAQNQTQAGPYYGSYTENPNSNLNLGPAGQPGDNQQPFNPQMANQPEQGMKWFKFIIYFQLFASAVLSLISGILYLTGSVWNQQEATASLMYSAFPSLKTVSILFGLCSILLAGFAIYVRMELAKFKKHGPMLYFIYLGANIGLSLILLIAVSSIVGQYVGGSSNTSSLTTSVILLVANVIYFKNRSHLFVN